MDDAYNYHMYYLWTLTEWIARNNKDEQDAILEYTYLLKFINEYREDLAYLLGAAQLNDIEAKVREHVSDEQQHSKELTEIYIRLTGIQVAED